MLICHDYTVSMYYFIVICLVLLIFPPKSSVSVLGLLSLCGLRANDLVSREIEGVRCLDGI